MSDAGPVHLDADEIMLRLLCGHFRKRLTIAKTDLQRPRCGTTKYPVQVCIVINCDTVFRPQLIKGALLAACDAALAPDEGTNRASVVIVFQGDSSTC